MIDTVVWKLTEGEFELEDKSFFDGQEFKKVDGRFSNNTAFLKTFREQQAKKGRYYPVLKLYKATSGKEKPEEAKRVLEVQISLPKAKHGTNLFEVDESDLDFSYGRAVSYLKEVKINTDKNFMKNAVLSRVDFSKVIVLPDYLGTSRQVIKEIAGFNYKPSSQFRLNYYDDSFDSVSVKFFNITQGYIIYGKFGEIEANGKTLFERQINEQIKKRNLKDTAIKFELALHRKQSMDALLRRITGQKKENFTLADVLNKDVAKTVLLEVFDKVFSPLHRQIITLSLLEKNRREAILKANNIPFAKRAILHQMANKALQIGIKGVWEELKAEMPPSTFDRYKKELEKLTAELGEIREKPIILTDFLRAEHEKFNIIKP